MEYNMLELTDHALTAQDSLNTAQHGDLSPGL